MSRFDTFIGTRRDESGAQIADIRAQLSGAKEETAQIAATTVDVPVVDNTFTPIFSRGKKKGKIFVTLRYANFGTANDIKVVLLPRASVLTSDDYDQLRITSKLVEAPFSDAVISTQLVVSAMETQFEPSTQYDIIRLVAIGKDGDDRAINPTPDPVFADYPGNVLFTFTTPVAFGAPSAPNASLIVFNRLDKHTLNDGDAEVGLKVYAPLTDGGAAQTFEAAGVDWVKVWLTRDIAGDAEPEQLPFQKLLSADELTQVDASSTPANRGYVIVVANNLKAGAEYVWTDNVVHTADEKNTASGSVAFNAGGFQTDPANLTSVSLTITSASEPYSAKHVKVVLNFTQPSTVIALKWVRLERKLSADADSTYQVVTEPNKLSLREDEFHTSGAKTVVLREALKAKPSRNYTLRCTIQAMGGTQRQFTQTFTTGLGEEVEADTAVPSSLQAPSLEWTAEGRFKVQGMQATTNIHTLKQRYLVITDGAGNYINLANSPPTVTTSEITARYPTGNKGHLNISWVKLKKWRDVFGASTTIFAYWYAENDLGVSSASSSSTGVSLATPYDHMGDRDTVRGLDVESTLTSPSNILGNGDVILQDAPGEVKNILRWNPTGLPITGNAVAIDNATANLRWDTTSHSIRQLTTTMRMVMPLKRRLQPGETYAFTMLIRSTTAGGWTTTVKLHFYNGQRSAVTGTANLTSSTSVTGTGTAFLSEIAVGDFIVISGQLRQVTNVANDTSLTVSSAFSAASGTITVLVDNIEDTIDAVVTFNDTDYHLFGAVVEMKDSPNLDTAVGAGDYANHFLSVELSAVTNDVYMDKFMMVRGEQPLAYAPRGEENDSGTVFVVPTFIAQPDIVEISGTAGGWREPNEGGTIF